MASTSDPSLAGANHDHNLRNSEPQLTPAYHSTSWPECYDLWVRAIFGDGPAEDGPVFTSALKSTLSNHDAQSPVVVLDIGTGTGRVLFHLIEAIEHEGLHIRDNNNSSSDAASPQRFQLIGSEPSQSMLDRAQRVYHSLDRRDWPGPRLPKQHRDDPPVPLQLDWLCDSATSFAHSLPTTPTPTTATTTTTAAASPAIVDLAIFAAGSITHLTEESDIARFLTEIKQCLRPTGRAVISVLRDFIAEGSRPAEVVAPAATAPSTTLGGETVPEKDDVVLHSDEVMRLPSRENPGQIYLKYPAALSRETVSGKTVCTERFKLEVVDEAGNLLKSELLYWQESIFDMDRWPGQLAAAGLRVLEKIDGKIQIWFIIGHE